MLVTCSTTRLSLGGCDLPDGDFEFGLSSRLCSLYFAHVWYFPMEYKHVAVV